MSRRSADSTLAGRRYDVDVGPVAHGGQCVARLPEELPEVGGTVVFVRHTAPGERVTVELTEGAVGDRFLRGDAVEVLRASPDRVVPPCSYAGPGRCGGCDFQHLAVDAQRRLKAQVVAEQLHRLAGLERDVVVEPVPGDDDGLRYRTRMRFHPAGEGRLGLRAHRSHRVVPVDDCLIQAPGAHVTVEGEPGLGRVLTETVLGREYDVAEDGFWQVHQGAPETLVRAVLDGAAVREGDRVLDLYSGVGLFTVPLAEATGVRGHVLAVEGDRVAVDHARANLAPYPWVEVVRGPVARVVGRDPGSPYDVVVLDPPREGAKRAVVEQVVARGPRTVVHVACDPASFARDTALLAGHDYALSSLRAFDLFPMTQHVEVVGTFARTGR